MDWKIIRRSLTFVFCDDGSFLYEAYYQGLLFATCKVIDMGDVAVELYRPDGSHDSSVVYPSVSAAVCGIAVAIAEHYRESELSCEEK